MFVQNEELRCGEAAGSAPVPTLTVLTKGQRDVLPPVTMMVNSL